MIKLLFRNKYLYFGAEIVCFYHRQEWITPNKSVSSQMSDLLFILLCVPFTAADYALTSVWPFGSLWCSTVMGLFLGANIFWCLVFSGPVPDHRDSPRLHLHPGPDVSWQVITVTTRNKILSWNISISVFLPREFCFIILVGHFISPQHSRVISKLLIYLDNFVKLLHILQLTLIINNL